MTSERMRRLWKEVSSLSLKATALWCLALTVAIELFTCLLRFGFGLESQKHSTWLAPVTFGWRVHHGYYGAVLLAAAAALRGRRSLSRALLIVGGALLLSDLVHHFLVLWPVTGSPEFYTRYPTY